MKPLEDQPVLSPPQNMFLVFGTIVGVGFLTMPRGVVEKAGEDAWLTVLLGGGVSLLSLILILRVAKHFPGETVLEYNQILYGRPLGFLLNLMIGGYFILFTITGIRTMAEVVRAEMLSFTPLEFIIATMLLTVLYASWHGLMPIARLNESGQPITLIFVVFYFLLAFFQADWNEWRIPFQNGVFPVLQPMTQTVYSYLGFEILYLYYPMLAHKDRAFGSAALGIVMASIFYTMVVIGSIVILSPDETIAQTYPVVTMAKEVEVVRRFVERAELLLLVLWLPLAFTTHLVTFYSSAFSLCRMFPRIHIRWWMLGLVPVVYYCSLIPDNLMETNKWSDVVGNTGLFFLLIYPMVTLITIYVRRKLERGKSRQGDAL